MQNEKHLMIVCFSVHNKMDKELQRKILLKFNYLKYWATLPLDNKLFKQHKPHNTTEVYSYRYGEILDQLEVTDRRQRDFYCDFYRDTEI